MNAAQQELDSLAHLEERITRAVELVASLRSEKSALESQLASAIAERDACARSWTTCGRSAKQVRTRIEKLLGQMDLLSGA